MSLEQVLEQSAHAQDNFSKIANWRKVPSCQNLRLTNSISQFRCTCPLLKLCIKKADWSSWGRGEPLKYASAKRRRESDFIKNRRKFQGHKTKNGRAMWRGSRQSHWEEERKSKSPELSSAIHRCLASPRAIGKAHWGKKLQLWQKRRQRREPCFPEAWWVLS